MELLDIMDKIDNEQSYLKKQQSILLKQSSYNPSSPPITTTSLPLAYSSPSHEFSFKVSLQSYASIDLTPADDIFFHGHLLPISPRSSTNSMDSFTLPMNLLHATNNPISNHQTTFSYFDKSDTITKNQKQPKSKSFSIFRIPKKENKERNNKKKLKLDLGQLIKRYIKMVRPLLTFPKSRISKMEFSHKLYSFSGSKPAEMNIGSKRRVKFSRPASMRASYGNSGILFGSGSVSPVERTSSESSLEELHAAIQAAIAHCKNSIEMADKI